MLARLDNAKTSHDESSMVVVSKSRQDRITLKWLMQTKGRHWESWPQYERPGNLIVHKRITNSLAIWILCTQRIQCHDLLPQNAGTWRQVYRLCA